MRYPCTHCLSSDNAWPCTVLHENVLFQLPPPHRVCVMLQAPAGQPPDVSARLRQACDMAAAAAS